MLKWLKDLFFGRSLDDHLNKTKKVKIKGTKFTLRKVNVLDHMDGSKVMIQVYDIYKTGASNTNAEVSEKKMKEHFSQVIVSGVVNPKLSHKEGGPGIWIEKLFVDWEMVQELYTEIMCLTYGKKKVRQSILQEQSLRKLTS